MDTETDDLIRQVITENFQDSTVIILANRFRLIVRMDKILVMDHGRVVEYDTPLALLENPKSKFSLMVSQNGDVDLARLREIAQNSADRSSLKSFDRSQSSSRSQDIHGNFPRTLAELFVRPDTHSLSNRSISSNSSISSDQKNSSFNASDVELQELKKQTSSSESLLKEHRNEI